MRSGVSCGLYVGDETVAFAPDRFDDESRIVGGQSPTKSRHREVDYTIVYLDVGSQRRVEEVVAAKDDARNHALSAP